MSDFTKKIGKLLNKPEEDIDGKLSLLDVATMLELQTNVNDGNKEEVEKILNSTDKITSKDTAPKKERPNVHRYSIGDDIEVDGEISKVKLPSTPHDTMGVLINGELTIVDKTNLHRTVKENNDMGDFDLGRLKELSGLSSSGIGKLSPPDITNEITDVAEIIAAIDEIEARIAEVRLSDFKPVLLRIEQMMDNLSRTGTELVVDDSEVIDNDVVDAEYITVDDLATADDLESFDAEGYVDELTEDEVGDLRSDTFFFNQFLRGYEQAALFADLPEEVEDGDYTVSDQAQAAFKAQCEEFISTATNEQLTALSVDPTRAGQMFWYTRNGHGTGFWDWTESGLDKAMLDSLTELSDQFDNVDLYVGDDSKVYAG